MTEDYWQKYKQSYDNEVFQGNEFWRDVKASMDRKYPKNKHYLELYNLCKSDNPFIRQIKHSPNITADTVAELICRDVGCDLQLCMSLQAEAQRNSRRPVE
jgi:hypothetical protein